MDVCFVKIIDCVPLDPSELKKLALAYPQCCGETGLQLKVDWQLEFLQDGLCSKTVVA